jgi:transposase InsO family protein
MMNALGLVLPPVRERDPDAPRGQVVAATSNRRWATDLTTVHTKEDGVVAIVPVVDCGDRVALECGVTKSQESPAVLAPTERALQAVFGGPAGVPDGLELRSDHGPQFTGADCAALARTWRLDHTLAPVGRPTGNAVAERFIQTLKVELIWTRDWDTLEEVRAAVAAWLHVYNTKRPHQALGWQTPAERRAQNLASARADAA